jgi:hypothetical protein
MIDDKLLDRMNFGELNQSLDYVLERIGKIEDELSEDEDDPRLDMLYVLANKIVMQMDSIVRENSRSNPEAFVQWSKVMNGYEERFDKYTDFFLEEDTLLDAE